ncbi:AraC family transcriptional regulator [Paenibacillus sp. MMS20-IR301]|uniref:AraC family transcriptional regulator n=1 Tax=Paenibacillus sp. MMS20-IR301 TaxID=2895946 RepID=UPI0028F06B3E|nr:AraC family transcriptional regulator [Paenibacillus sp. MMS20-IR301]WNS43156.1 AraC family transcriptional regulator [Paenibacillus sp. MMS20-IR301]
MDINRYKSGLPPVFNKLCREIRVQDAVIEWVDIIFEQIGTASKCPPHAHTWFEFNYVLSGQMGTRFDGDELTVNAGEFFLIPPGRVHSHTYTRGNPHEGLCFRWRLRPADPGQAADGGHLLYARLKSLQEWRPGAYSDEEGFSGMLEHFLSEADTAAPSELSLQLLLIRLLERLCQLQQTLEGHTESPAAVADPLVRKVEIYMEEYLGDRLNVEELAASLHMSYGHLSREYKRLTGNTIIGRMNSIRLEKARELLLLPGSNISEAAEQAGFADLSYFSKAFKKKYGQAPQSYRKSNTGSPE